MPVYYFTIHMDFRTKPKEIFESEEDLILHGYVKIPEELEEKYRTPKEVEDE